MRNWVGRHRKLSAVIGAITVVVTGFIATTEIWQGFSNEPLVPALSQFGRAFLPDVPRFVALAIWGGISVVAFLFVVAVWRNTRQGTANPVTSKPSVSTIERQVICERCGTLPGVEKYCFWWSGHNYTGYSGVVICQHCGIRAPTEKRMRCTAKTYHTFKDFRTSE